MRKLITVFLTLCMLLSVLASCTTPETPENENSDSSETEKVENNESSSETEKVKETESESESEPVVIEPALPDGDADLSYATADGYIMKQYNGKGNADYLAACAYYESEGYALYNENLLGNVESATYVKDSAYAVVMLNLNKSELYIGESESGAENLPGDSSDYLDLYDTTITQHYSPENNGMGYFFRLADGSFIIFDGGYKTDAADSFETLVRLNDNSEKGIRIRAWFITHSHGDHYQMFSQFASDYADKVTLDALYYSPIADELDDKVPQDPYLTTRVNVDISRFEGAKTVFVHAGMAFNIADVKIEVICAPEHIYKNEGNTYFNESSIVCRVSDDEGGAAIITGDIGALGCEFMIGCYGEGLKSNIAQLSHHGSENAIGEFYDCIAPSTVFIPASADMPHNGKTKQTVFQSDYAKEFLAHGMGNVTHKLNHIATDPEYVDIMPMAASMVTGIRIENITLEDGVLKYNIIKTGQTNDNGEPAAVDAYFYYTLNKKYDFDSSRHNAIKLVLKSEVINEDGWKKIGGEMFYAFGDTSWKAEQSAQFFQQGITKSDTYVVYIYLGNCPGYSDGNVKTLRFDIGGTQGQEITVYSIEAFTVEVDDVE